jgi:hypothetical protein
MYLPRIACSVYLPLFLYSVYLLTTRVYIIRGVIFPLILLWMFVLCCSCLILVSLWTQKCIRTRQRTSEYKLCLIYDETTQNLTSK